MAEGNGEIDDVLPAELNRLALDDALQLARGDQRAGGGESAKNDFEAQGAALHRSQVVDVDHELADADQRRGQRAEGVRERSSLRHGGHGNGQTAIHAPMIGSDGEARR